MTIVLERCVAREERVVEAHAAMTTYSKIMLLFFSLEFLGISLISRRLGSLGMFWERAQSKAVSKVVATHGWLHDGRDDEMRLCCPSAAQ